MVDDPSQTCAWVLCETYARWDVAFCSPTCRNAARQERERYEAFCTGIFAIRRQARPAPASRPESAGRRIGRPRFRKGAQRSADGSPSLF